MEKDKFENSIQLLRDFSERLNIAFNSETEFVKLLNLISQPGRNSLLAIYQNAKGPVKEIRKNVAEILSVRDIKIEELQSIINRSVVANPQSFKSMYKNWYNMLYMFLIQDFRREMNEAVEFICASIIYDLNGENKIIAKKFDFTGERETGSTRCWIAMVNKTHPSQITAKQLFIDIHNGEIEYCLYDWPNRNKIGSTVLSKGQKFKYEDFIIIFKKYLPEIINDDFNTEINFWRIDTSDRENSYWNEMRSNGKMCIGWSELGNLKDAKVKNRKDVIALFTDEGIYKDDNRTKSRKAGEILSFYKDSKIGDIILAQDGATILAIGRIKSDYFFNESADFSHEKDIEWLIEKPSFTNSEGLRATFVILSDENLIRQIKELLNFNASEVQNKTNYKISAQLNQILFGPPGTGKTFSTINKAIQIINPEFDLEQDRQVVKEEFDRLIQNGQIVFTTFHQSMSYEDFIEGIKPLKPDEEDEFVKYDIKDGIFKNLSRKALKEYYKLSSDKKPFERINSFEEGWDSLLQRVQVKINSNDVLHLPTISKQAMDVIAISDRGNLYLKPQYKDAKEYTVSHDRLKKLFEAISDLKEVKNIDKEFRAVIGGANSTAYWSVLNEVLNWLKESPVTKSVEQIIEISESLIKFESKIVKENISDKVPKYVLIIDEINRGNISQILEELITLIEDDKRLGRNEAIEITLPYSKEKFGVPPNLYIIGTMNTADRSVEALDTALRRRFSFEEMPPKYKLPELEYEVYGYPASDILKTINHRIEKLLDRDHAIGHSYFINKNEESIIDSFYKCIIPLLQEYFFGDYGKIGLVLGKGFISKKEWDKSLYSFADFDYEGLGDFDEKEVFRIIDYRSDELTTVLINKHEVEMDFGKAIQLLMKGSAIG